MLIQFLPLALKGISAITGAIGLKKTFHGVSKTKEAKGKIESVQKIHEQNMKKLEKENSITSRDVDKLGKLELEILDSFKDFSDIFEKIKNKPTFEAYIKNEIVLPKYDGEKLKEVSIGAGVLLSGLGGVGLGVAGGFAAAGATTAAVTALGTASTGTAIASLNGVAMTNATLAALGGGSIAMGGGGMAAGTVVLGATTLGVGLLVGGIIFSFAGDKLSDKSNEAWQQMEDAKIKIDEICKYLVKLRGISNKYCITLSKVNSNYKDHLKKLKDIVNVCEHKDWNTFTIEEKKVTENTVLLVGLLYNMCKVELVIKAENDINTINDDAIHKSIKTAKEILSDIE